ncbi:hypothetical protein X777_02657 [Ooceraea biroi]|uniref:Uncharacterized protein n=1 Tax=Ooceraea biroi TaxID=2015173 RepID=A0A026WMB7_OOCBI|nr:hypothetical protein X777_02657 [Ooceraea biroi]
MITKQPKSGFVQTLKKGGKALLIFEGALLLGSYGIWRCMNTSQDIVCINISQAYWRLTTLLGKHYLATIN